MSQVGVLIYFQIPIRRWQITCCVFLCTLELWSYKKPMNVHNTHSLTTALWTTVRTVLMILYDGILSTLHIFFRNFLFKLVFRIDQWLSVSLSNSSSNGECEQYWCKAFWFFPQLLHNYWDSVEVARKCVERAEMTIANVNRLQLLMIHQQLITDVPAQNNPD